MSTPLRTRTTGPRQPHHRARLRAVRTGALAGLQAAYWRKQFGKLSAQVEEMGGLSTKVEWERGGPYKGAGDAPEEFVKRIKSN